MTTRGKRSLYIPSEPKTGKWYENEKECLQKIGIKFIKLTFQENIWTLVSNYLQFISKIY